MSLGLIKRSLYGRQRWHMAFDLRRVFSLEAAAIATPLLGVALMIYILVFLSINVEG